MKVPRQIAVWGMVAAVSLAALTFALVRQNKDVRQRSALQVRTSSLAGSEVFREKGCGACHGPNATGTPSGPALRQRQSLSGLPQLVTAMWNHAPRMWEKMRARGLEYPALSYEDTSQIISYLYISGYADNGGDPDRGRALFARDQCVRCHTATKSSGPELKRLAEAGDPLAWTQALWNHASEMRNKMTAEGITWPRFQPSDMRDLFAYVRHAGGSGDQPAELRGDPDRGWRLFQQKGCISCHAVSSEATRMGPNLGPERPLPPTFSEFGAAMLNHFPQMENAVERENSDLPRFEDHEMTDVAVFLYTLHYLEPTGSPQIGKSVFAWRGCSRCHGDNAEGTREGPALRGRGRAYTAARLATDLWGHGARMYENSRRDGQAWPALQSSDIGHLLTFLNVSPEK
ncbi:MAG TPA: c-type cytochrome [Terriglobales bacterium]|nr:c-type cytochrome [Terriglobales bacterium]